LRSGSGQPQPALEEQRRALADEMRRAERALARYYAARGLRTATFSGRTWDRTRDLSRVKRALSRFAGRNFVLRTRFRPDREPSLRESTPAKPASTANRWRELGVAQTMSSKACR
jgi:hypothetical protein